MKNELSIKKVTALGIGIALFVVASYIVIPTGVPNTSIQPRIAILGFFSIVFGPVVGFLVGFIGHALADALQWGSVWWSWVIAEGIFGLVLGLFASRFKVEEKLFTKKKMITFNIIQFITNIVAWFLVAPTLDVLIYAEPKSKVFLQGITSVIVNTIAVGIISTFLLYQYSKMKAGNDKLTEEE